MTVVLAVDDDAAILRTLGIAMRARGYEVETVADGRSALQSLTERVPDVVLLDLGLPDLDGTEVLRRIRETSQVPVVVLSARHESDDKVEALDLGADDYVTKPFGMEELLARVRAALRRAAPTSAPVLTVGDLVLDEDSRDVTRGGTPVELTATEFELLRYLMRNPRRVLSKAQILDRVWHYDFGGQANVVELYISYLRKKIDAGRAPMIHTKRGAGYVLKPAEDA